MSEKDNSISIRHTLCKSERLYKKNDIQELFQKGSSFFIYPFKVKIIFSASDASSDDFNQILISVPKRTFKRANKRNLIKRRIRESYRLQKHLLGEIKSLKIAFLYVGKETHDFEFISKQVSLILNKILTLQNTDHNENSD